MFRWTQTTSRSNYLGSVSETCPSSYFACRISQLLCNYPFNFRNPVGYPLLLLDFKLKAYLFRSLINCGVLSLTLITNYSLSPFLIGMLSLHNGFKQRIKVSSLNFMGRGAGGHKIFKFRSSLAKRSIHMQQT